jgi:transposase InsO family protein
VGLRRACGEPGWRLRTRGARGAGAAPIDAKEAATGKPTDNAFAEASNGRVRAECRNAHWFLTLADAQEKLAAWRGCDDEDRPIGRKPPISLQNPGGASSQPP